MDKTWNIPKMACKEDKLSLIYDALEEIKEALEAVADDFEGEESEEAQEHSDLLTEALDAWRMPAMRSMMC